MDVYNSLISRRSVRRFLPKEVDQSKIKKILEGAAFAPSGHNIQPWHVYVVTGDKKKKITNEIIKSIESGEAKNFKQEFDYYPTEWYEPYISRRRAVGFELYKLLGIAKDDYEARNKQMQENFHFFGAPVGMFIQSILVGARGEGLHTCGQVAFTKFHSILSKELGFDENEMLVCGVSMGYEDENAPENKLRVEKLTHDQFSTFMK